MIRYGSVCSGIEAATVAWHSLGWRAAFFAEIEKFPSAVLSHRWPGVPNLGDFTKIGREYIDGPIDLLVGGTPCQSFSVAGRRLGLDDPRGNLALEYLALARRLRPHWLVFENVPGLLSSDGGRDFGTFLALMGECGYGWAYRVLDAQYVRVDTHPRAVPQRRRRVFVVGYLGDWRPAAAVLFEPEGLRGDSPPGRQAGERSACPVAARSARGSGYRNDADTADNMIAATLDASAGGADENDAKGGRLVAVGGNDTRGQRDVATAVRAKGGTGHGDFESETFVVHPLRGDGFDASEDGTRRGTPLVAFSCKDHGADAREDTSPTLRAMGHDGSHANAGGQVAIAAGSAVRRVTPRECERLQGFPDDYTLIAWRGRHAAQCPDGPRYKALGNSMAVNVMRWLGLRIDLFERTARRAA